MLQQLQPRRFVNGHAPRCGQCGCKAQAWQVSEVTCKNPCSEPGAPVKVHAARAKMYPLNSGAVPCVSYERSGVCRQFERTGLCRNAHIPPSTKYKERCCICSLELPCWRHFPEIGEVVKECADVRLIENRNVLEAVGRKQSTSSVELSDSLTKASSVESEEVLSASQEIQPSIALDVKPQEIVAINFRNEWRYGVVEEQQRDTGLLIVNCCCPPEKPKQVKIVSTRVVKLHGLFFRGESGSASVVQSEKL